MLQKEINEVLCFTKKKKKKKEIAQRTLFWNITRTFVTMFTQVKVREKVEQAMPHTK